MDWRSAWWAAPWRGVPPLTVATSVMYGCGFVLLVGGAATWEPGKNPRWVISLLAVVALVFFVWATARGRRFTPAEATVMTAVQVFTVGCLTWTTHLMLGALANGTVLPIVGVYVIWFLHPVAGRVVLYLGTLWWFVAIVHQQTPSLIPFALSLAIQTLVATEVFARIKQRLDRLASTDPLTGVLNRRGVTDLLAVELSRATRQRRELAVVAIDIDGLREVNNTSGHRAGDQLLERTTQHWSSTLRGGDAIGRIGGDEFVLVLPATSQAEAEVIVERLALASPGSWSAGIAVVEPGDDVATLLERADRRMYVEKTSRRSG